MKKFLLAASLWSIQSQGYGLDFDCTLEDTQIYLAQTGEGSYEATWTLAERTETASYSGRFSPGVVGKDLFLVRTSPAEVLPLNLELRDYRPQVSEASLWTFDGRFDCKAL